MESFYRLGTYILIGSWSQPLEPGNQPAASFLSSNRNEARGPIEYSKEDIAHIEKWDKNPTGSPAFANI